MPDVLIYRHDQTFPRLAGCFPGGRKLSQGNRPAHANGRAKKRNAGQPPVNRQSNWELRRMAARGLPGAARRGGTEGGSR
ncbi:MAG: hypothetical protein QOG05_3367 [Streptosporangiaceae bacterium]|nr:hypothetical protein [Streptosporangiaceae bacterium]